MKVILRGTTTQYDKHRTLVFTAHVPNWFQYFFLFKRVKLINYVGYGSVWRRMSFDTYKNGRPTSQVSFHDVTDKKLIHQLRGWEEGEKFYNRNKK